jgi:hypothetical protein
LMRLFLDSRCFSSLCLSFVVLTSHSHSLNDEASNSVFYPRPLFICYDKNIVKILIDILI